MTFDNAFINGPYVIKSFSVKREQWQCVGSFTRSLLRLCVILSVLHNRMVDNRLSYTGSCCATEAKQHFPVLPHLSQEI